MSVFRLQRDNPDTYFDIRRLREKYIRQTDYGISLPGVIGFDRPMAFPLYPRNPPEDSLVALHKAGKLFDRLPTFTVPDLLEKGKALGFTQYGEILSNEWMADLAMTIWPNVTAAVAPLPDAHELAQMIINKKVVLFAYDCGYKFDPMLDKGQSAHWGVATGFVYVTHSLHIWKMATETDSPFFDEERESLHVLCHHAKSEFPGFYNWSGIQASNAQLNQFRTDRDYIVPDGGMQLKGACVILSKDEGMTSLVTANPMDVPLDPEEEETFKTFAHHGNSDNTALFNWKKVRNSNSQLNEVRTDKDYIVPDDGMQMKGSCVSLSKDEGKTSFATANPTDVPLDPEEEETFHTSAHHGKSDNTALFNWKKVRNSNSQLNEVRTDKDYIVSDDGMQKALPSFF